MALFGGKKKKQGLPPELAETALQGNLQDKDIKTLSKVGDIVNLFNDCRDGWHMYVVRNDTYEVSKERGKMVVKKIEQDNHKIKL